MTQLQPTLTAPLSWERRNLPSTSALLLLPYLRHAGRHTLTGHAGVRGGASSSSRAAVAATVGAARPILNVLRGRTTRS